MNRQDFHYFHRLRVRWVEVDMQKIVFNAHYAMYLDTAFAGYWRALALPYEEAMHQLQGDLYLKKITLEYAASARYDDVLDVGLRCTRIGNSSLQFMGAVFRGNQLLVSGELIYVFADPATQTSRPVPEALRELFKAFEAKESVTTLKVGSWSELGEAASKVRAEVFVQEQNIPAEMEWDEADKTAIHAVALNRLGMPLATGRLLQAEPRIGQIGRMAVNRVLRGSSLGRDVVNALSEVARARGDKEIILHAQRSAEGFYARLGYTPKGEPFDEAGIPHITMAKAL